METKIEQPKHYQVNVTVLEARHLSLQNVNTVVKVELGNVKKKMLSRTRKTDRPYYNKLFRLHYHGLQEHFLKQHLRIAICQASFLRLLGECCIEMVSVWEQTDHQFYHKWAILTHPKDPVSGIKGYVKCDIQILEEGVNKPKIKAEHNFGTEIEGNLMVPFESNFRRQNALFTLNIFHADNIYAINKTIGKVKKVDCRNMYVKVSFAGKSSCTRVAKDETRPVWNEGLPFVEHIPSLYQTISIELWDKRQDILIGANILSLNKLWNQANIGVLPSFGPSSLYLYKTMKKAPFIHIMSAVLIVELTCRLLEYGETAKALAVKQIAFPEPEKTAARHEYILLMVLMKGVCFKKKYLQDVFIRLRHGLQPQNLDRDTTSVKILNVFYGASNFYIWQCENRLPIVYCEATWPATDIRERWGNHIKFAVTEITNQLKAGLRLEFLGKNAEATKICKGALVKAKKHFNRLIAYPKGGIENSLDVSNRIECREHLSKFKKCCDSYLRKKDISPSEIYSSLEEHFQKLLNFANSSQCTFPDFEIALVKSPKRIKTQINMKATDYLYAPELAERGQFCGKLRTIFFRNRHGSEIAAIDAIIFLCKTTELRQFSKFLPGAPKQIEECMYTGTLTLDREFGFQLRVYVYQGRVNRGSDSSGLADPFIRVTAFGKCQETKVITQTLDPFWDQMLFFPQITLYGDRNYIKRESTGIIFEVLDYDWGKHVEMIGRGVVRPKITFLHERYVPIKLAKEPAYQYGEKTAEILMAMDLIEISHDQQNDLNFNEFSILAIPDEIRPHFKKHTMYIIFWGLRKFRHRCLPYPKVFCIAECCGVRVESNIVVAHNTTNFKYEIVNVELSIPEEEEYYPPFVVSLYEVNACCKPTYKGGSLVTFAKKFLVKNQKSGKSTKHLIPLNSISWQVSHKESIWGDRKRRNINNDWWTKYFYSRKHQDLHGSITIFDGELEKQPQFDDFQDHLSKFHLKKGKYDIRKSKANPSIVGILKCAIVIKENDAHMSTPFHSFPGNDTLDVTIRVYIVGASDLPPTDINGRCDPYVVLRLGKAKRSNRKKYVYKETNPIFGQYFEFKARFPWDHTLKIKVMDHDVCDSDDLIGETEIDVENRFYSKHRATCGIASSYEIKGAGKWRDFQQPSEILEEICRRQQIPLPQYAMDSINIGKHSIRFKSEGKQKACLKILRNFEKVPEFGFALVPEHVECRPLFHPKKHGIEQGKLEMWVDIFPGHSSAPPPIDITPQDPEALELRATVWNMVDIPLADVSLLTRNRSSDVYVKAWLADANKSQKTDIHYRSFGEAIFNWRFIFPFTYSPNELKMVVGKKGFFSKKVWKDKVPCTLNLQVWDNDMFNDDYLGSLSLELGNMPVGAEFANKCSLKMLDPAYKQFSLFKITKTRGWWPIRIPTKQKGKEYNIAGKIDLELEILTASQAKANPAGLGRAGPNPLPEPDRPVSSILWHVNPLTMARRACFGGLQQFLPWIVSLIFILLTTYSIIWNVPAALINRIIGRSS